MKLVEASIADLRAALEAGRTTSVSLVAAYLDRIARYDRHGIALNAVPVLNPDMFAEARASDLRRAEGRTLGPLDGIPYTAKDSYKVKGLTVAAGSPAFADLIATAKTPSSSNACARRAPCCLWPDQHAADGQWRHAARRLWPRRKPLQCRLPDRRLRLGLLQRLRHRDGGQLRRLRPGRGDLVLGPRPASNNGLCAYTPSRGVISTRGNWPLVPTMDVVVPHSRSDGRHAGTARHHRRRRSRDARRLLAAPAWVAIPKASSIRARHPTRRFSHGRKASLKGKRFGMPAMYINADPEAGTGENVPASAALPDSGSTPAPRCHRIVGASPRHALEAAGAEVVVTTFPVVTTTRRPPRRADHRDTRPCQPRLSRSRDQGPLGLVLGRFPRRQWRPRLQAA
jgi:amidase